MKIITTHDKIVSLENVYCINRYLTEEYYTSKGKKYTEYVTTFHFSYNGGQTAVINITESNNATPKANDLWEEIQCRLSAD